MIAEIGHFALVLALSLALVQAVLPLIGAQRGEHGMMKFADVSAPMQFLLVLGAFLALMHAFVTLGFLCGQRLPEFALGQADALQGGRGLGEP